MVRIHSLNENYFENIDTPDKAYWLGFILADGCIYKPVKRTNYCLEVSISIPDQTHVIKLCNSLDFGGAIRVRSSSGYKGKQISSVQIWSNKLTSFLMEHGEFTEKTQHAQVPIIESSLYPHFWRGYFDGDGGVWTGIKYDKKRSAYYPNWNASLVGTENIVTGFKNFLHESTGQNFGHVRNRKTWWEISYSGKASVQKLSTSMNYLQDNISLDRKKEMFVKLNSEVQNGK